jgi:hypothetical protein
MPTPHLIEQIPAIVLANPKQPTCMQPRRGAKARHTDLPSGAQQRIMTQQAINILTIHKQAVFSKVFTPRALMKHAKMPLHFKHYVNAMVYPVTGCTISSYKKMMHDPATAEVWQTAFGKDFGGMAQGCNKTGQKGTNAMFIMTHDKIAHTFAEIFFLLTRFRLSITALRRTILTEFASRRAAT